MYASALPPRTDEVFRVARLWHSAGPMPNRGDIFGLVLLLGALTAGCSRSHPEGPPAGTDADADADADGDADLCPEPAVPTGDGCPAQCSSCADGECLIDCTGSEACLGESHFCPPDFDCRVVCTGHDACDSGAVHCPTDYGCTLECEGDDPCGHVEMFCGAGPCTVQCAASTSNACNDVHLYCDAGPCTAICEDPDVDQPILENPDRSCDPVWC